jgi:predicted MFS family arabinose efflux permease
MRGGRATHALLLAEGRAGLRQRFFLGRAADRWQRTIIKRVLQVIPVLFVVVTITFVLTRMIPGNPAAVMLGPQASPDAIATMTEKLGLDKPMLEQYADYLVGIRARELRLLVLV